MVDLIKKKNLEIIDIVNCISFSKVCIYSYMTNFELSDVMMHADLLFSIANWKTSHREVFGISLISHTCMTHTHTHERA